MIKEPQERDVGKKWDREWEERDTITGIARMKQMDMRSLRWAYPKTKNSSYVISLCYRRMRWGQPGQGRRAHMSPKIWEKYFRAIIM